MIILITAISITTYAQDYIPNQIIVQFDLETNSDNWLKAIDSEYPEYQVAVDKVLSKRMNMVLFNFDTTLIDAPSLVKITQETEGVLVAQVNHTGVKNRVTTPNDLNYSTQWSLGSNSTGRIYAPEAWDIETDGLSAKGDSIVIAVIDGGFSLSHVDLQFFTNSNEIANNGIDDDNNGYIDDYYGWDAYNSDGTIPSDNHGTHVSGIVGAKTNNTDGVAGIIWDAKILPVAGSSGTESVVLEAYGYVLEMRALYNSTNGAKGAYVVATNSSFGVDLGDPADYPLWCGFYDSLGAYGILSAAATANAYWNIDTYGDVPTACTSNYMIAVTNTNQNGAISSAGYGATSIDLGAPGSNIYSTVTGNGYSSLSGTSMATPHVAGSIALMHSAMCNGMLSDFESNPAGLALWVKNAIIANTDASSSLSGKSVSGGRLNLYNSMLAVEQYECFSVSPNTYYTCGGACPVEVGPIITGSSDSITYLWSNGSTDSSITSCEASYTVTVIDADSNVYVETVSVIENDSITTNLTAIEPINNEGGEITIAAIGGAGDYSYNWSTGGFTSTLSDLGIGEYFVTVTDSVGCIAYDSVTFQTSGNIYSSCGEACPFEVGPYVLTNTSYSYSWSDGSTDSTILACEGEYTVTITDAENNVFVETVTINENDSIVINSVISEPNSTNDGEISLTPSGGSGSYAYMWSTGDTTSSISNINSGSYTVTVTDSNGCSVSTSFVLYNVGTAELEALDKIKVYPNPSNGTFTISSNSEIDQVEIYDLTGRSVNQLKVNANTTEVNLTDQTRGVYIVRIVLSGGGTKLTKVTVLNQ